MKAVSFYFNRCKEKNLLRNGVLFILYAIINNGIGFLIVILISRFIPPSEYGTLNLFTTLITIISIIISLGTISYPSIDFFKVSKYKTSQNYSVVFCVTIIVTLLLLILFIVLKEYIVLLSGLSIGLLLLALIVAFMQQITGEALNIFRLEEKVGLYGSLSIGNAVLSCILTFILVIGFSLGWMGRLYSLVSVSCILFVVSACIIVKKKYICLNRTFLQKKLFGDALKYGLPLVPHSLSWWLKQGSDRFIINYYHGSAAVGLFSFGFNFANILVIISEAFNATYSVTIFKELSQKEDAVFLLLRKNYYILSFYLGISLIIMLVTHMGIPFFFPKYIESMRYIYPLCLSAFFQSVYYIFVNFLFFRKKTKILMFITFGSSLLHFMLSMLLTKYDPLIAAYLLLFTNVIISVCVVFYVNKLYNLPWARVYNSIVKC